MSLCRWRRVRHALAALSAAALLSACAAVPTRVTLLPDRAGHLGAVAVGNAHGRQGLEQAYASVEADADTAPRLVAAGGREAFEARHRALLDAQPAPPLSFVLHFLFDSMELTPESTQKLPGILAAVRARLPTEVTVFGYADSAGEPAYNMALSAERARAVVDVLRKIDPDLPVRMDWFGDKSPLVPTAPGVPEPRNRRAEILIL
ncbi:OmpA family protein [Coralloluteibacterium stylophorae]|uniref:OmpA family protein n=1 Tax=Coralloluteibacterium stylophorae TaxID=1776034 RepID=A0A8J7VQ79_9GAMM|nr:OmpA family protein [Coralloluteibacterium stylophorae]MBS7457361.1 OmpA family protein [Coralloluteibacterium stylophorae]